MTVYAFKVNNNEQLSLHVQEALFKLGYSWARGKMPVQSNLVYIIAKEVNNKLVLKHSTKILEHYIEVDLFKVELLLK